MQAMCSKGSPGLRGKHEEKETMMVLARVVLPPLALHSLTLSGVLLATVGAIFLAYDLLGRENGPLRWFTLVMTCGIVSTLIFVPVVTLVDLLLNHVSPNLSHILPLVLAGGLMGFYTVILVELPPSDTRPPLFSWRGSLLGLALALLFWLVGVLAGPQYVIPALALGVACAVLTSTWQRLTCEPTQAVATAPAIGQSVAGEEPPASTPSSSSTGQFEAWKPAHPRPHVFSRQGVVLGLLLGFLMGFAFFFTANKDAIASLLESAPLALISGVICGTWRYINWEPPHPTPHLFSRKGFWTGLVAGFVPWLLFNLSAIYLYAGVPNYTGARKGFEAMIQLCITLVVVVSYALANAAAGSIAQYTLWRANQLPHRTLGVIGVVLLVVAFAFQGVQPVIDILNDLK
jgi:hypothetical protein